MIDLFAKNRQGNALLISILIMAVLLVVGLGINRLIITELRVERMLVQGGQAFYAAEGAVEQALLDANTYLEGYEGEGQSVDVGNGAGYFYEIFAQGDVWPCDDYGHLTYEDDSGDLWRVLELEESVMIPLFRYETGGLEKINDFDVDFYVDSDVAVTGDVLRWKILGISEGGLTEAISDYLENFQSWSADTESAGFMDSFAVAFGGREYNYIEDYNVQSFLDSHNYNYLIITNIAESGVDNDIHLRLDNGDGEFVCEYVKIEADGVNGDFIQQIDVVMKEGEPLPVFDFVLWEKDTWLYELETEALQFNPFN